MTTNLFKRPSSNLWDVVAGRSIDLNIGTQTYSGPKSSLDAACSHPEILAWPNGEDKADVSHILYVSVHRLCADF